MIILKRKIYTAILTQYLIHLKAIENYSVFKQEVCAFNDDFTYMFWKEMNFGRIKKEKRLFFILIPFNIVLAHSYRADTIGDTELLI